MMKIRAAAKFLLIPVCCLLFSGCIKIVNLQDRAIVQGVGVDYQDGQYLITMQIFSSDGSGGQTIIDFSKQNAKVITCRGKTISEAVEDTSISQGKDFFLGHNRLVILGESARELPLSESLSYFINTMDSRADVNVLLAEKSASEVLNADINQGILPALTIEKTVQNADDSGKISEVLLIDILRSLAAEHQSALIPVIAIAQGEDAANGVDESKKLKNIELTGMAVFSEGMYQGTLNESETRGMMFLRDEIQKTVYSVFNEDFREISVELYRSNTKIVPHINGDDLQFTVKINADGMVQEKVLEAGKSFNEKSLRRVEDVIQEKIRSECEEAFQKAVGEYKSDVFYLGDMVWRDQPELWEKIQDDWKENAGKIKLSYDITVDIDRTGLQENFKGVL